MARKARSVSGVIFMVMLLVVPGAVCKQQEHLLQGKRLISGLMKPENTCHVPAHAAVVPELRNHWQELRTAFLCCVPTKALGLWSKIIFSHFPRWGRHLCQLIAALPPSHPIYAEITHSHPHRCDPHNFPCENGKFSIRRQRMD